VYCAVTITEVTEEEASQPGGRNPLKDLLDNITSEIVSKLANFGGKIQTVLQGVGRRWRRRILYLLDAGTAHSCPCPATFFASAIKHLPVTV
jgi:hypothetical protein